MSHTQAPSAGGSSSTVRFGTRFESLTGLRFVAAALVFMSHVGPTAYFANQSINMNIFRIFSHAGTAAVSFFFILSGFVMTLSARPGDTPGRFIRRRFVKIFPNHLVTFVFAALLFHYAFTLSRGIPNLFLLHAWVPRVETFFSVDPVSWTLSCELLFYLSFPFIYPLLSRIRPQRLWLSAAVTVGGIVALWVIASNVLPDNPPLSFPPLPVGLYEYWFVYIFPPVRLLEFVLGIIIARIVLSGRWIRVGMAPCALLVLGAYALTDQAPALLSLTVIMVVPLALLVGATGWTDLTGQPSILRNRVGIWFGEISFAFYLVHILILAGSRFWLGRTNFFSVPQAIGLIVLAFAASVLASWLMYRLVERPMVRRFSNPRRRPPANVQSGHEPERVPTTP